MSAEGMLMLTDFTQDRYLTKTEAARYLGISVRWLEELRRGNNPPPSFKLGQRLLFRRSELDAWVEQYRVSKLTLRANGGLQ